MGPTSWAHRRQEPRPARVLWAGVAIALAAMGCIPPQLGDARPEPPAVLTAAPEHLLITGRGQVPPDYQLRWVAPTDVNVDRFRVFRSNQPITPENREAAFLAASADQDLRVRIEADTGTQFFRVSAVTADGVEGPLSDEYELDTTARTSFRADATLDEAFEIFTVSITGGPIERVSGVVTQGHSASDHAWSPDGRFVAFLADLNVQGQPELYVSRVGGAAIPIRMSGAPVSWAQVRGFAWSPDARRLAFIADRLVDEAYDLYVVPIATGSPRLVSQLLARRTGYDGVRQFEWSPDGRRLAFASDAITDELFELFTVNVLGTDVLRVSAALAPLDDGLQGVSNFAWSPDPRTAVLAYIANAVLPGRDELFVVPAVGGGVLNVSGPLVEGGTVSGFAWSPDGARIAFLADKSVPGAVALWVASPDGTQVAPVSGVALPETSVTEFAWSRDARFLAFHGDIEVPGLPGLYAVDADGANRRLLSGALVSTTTIQPDWAWSPDSRRVAFRGTLSIRATQELFIAAADGAGVLPAIAPLLAGRSVEGFVWSSDGAQLVYSADDEIDDQFVLFRAPTDVLQGVSLRLNDFLPLFGDVTHAATSPLSSDDVPAGSRVTTGP